MGEGCSPEMMREHESRITKNTASTESAHHRITGVVDLIKDFTVEMRESNANIAEMVSAVKLLTQEVGHIARSVDSNREDIEDIKDNMETKDTVLKLYERIEESTTDYKKGMDAIMTKLRETDEDLEAHKLEPAKQALEDQKAFKKWLIAGFGGIILSIITSAILFIIFGG